jgi:hypothetical protein
MFTFVVARPFVWCLALWPRVLLLLVVKACLVSLYTAMVRGGIKRILKWRIGLQIRLKVINSKLLRLQSTTPDQISALWIEKKRFAHTRCTYCVDITHSYSEFELRV